MKQLVSLIQNDDLIQYYLSNTISTQSRVINDYDRSVEFERFGGKVIEQHIGMGRME